jgi:hypothetical protein
VTTRTNRHLARVATMLAVICLAVSCGEEASDGTTAPASGETPPDPTVESLPDDPVTTELTDDTTGATDPPVAGGQGDGEAEPVVIGYMAPQSGLAEPASAEVAQVIATDDPHRVVVVFWAGSDDCFGLVGAEAQESEREVAIEVVVGRRPPADAPCVAIARQYATAVELEQPLGDRQVLDASAATEMPRAPDEYATATFEAWAGGDTNMLARLTSDEAFAVLSERAWTDEDGWSGVACEGAAGSTFCTWQSDGEHLVLRVANEAASGAAPDAVVEATFSAAG